VPAKREWTIAERISAVIRFELVQGKMTGLDFDAAELDLFHARRGLDDWFYRLALSRLWACLYLPWRSDL
jgi:hypothetical protein